MDDSIEYSRHLDIIRGEVLKPSVLYQQSLKISLDGNKYCVLFGTNLMEGVAGFGDTLAEALIDFDSNFYIQRAPFRKEIHD
jgi:hypothetical protein